MDLFGTAGIRGDVRTDVTPALALSVGRAAGREGEEFVVGRDGRTTGTSLAAAVEAGLTSAGTDVIRVGQVPTPALADASRGRRGVMLTASHNPPADNGIKLFEDGQEYDSEQEATIERRVADDGGPVEWPDWGERVEREILPEYREAVAEYARQFGGPLDGIEIAVDCGNGMASVATPQVLRALDGEVHALEANVDGHFPARESKPTPETLRQFRTYVAESGVALGIGHDGDADRIVIVNRRGEIVHEDTVVAILAAHYVEQSAAADPVVVTTPNASGRIDERVKASGGRVERVRLGALHEGIARARDAGEDGTEVVFAAEPWKHIHTHLGGWIDGVASAAVFARLVADRGLPDLRAPITERPYRKENVECPDERKAGAMAALEDRLPAAFPDATVDTRYGVRLSFPDDAWTLVRPSGTEPYIRVYAEADDVDDLISSVTDTVEAAVE